MRAVRTGLLIAWDVAAIVYLLWMWLTIARLQDSDTSDFALREDPSRSVWVLDNGSTDGSAARLAEIYPQVHLVESSENRGFAAERSSFFSNTEKCPLIF